MLPPALGGLRSRVPPVPGRRAPGSMEKIKVPCGHPQDIGIILHPPFRRQIANWNAAKMATLPVNGLRGRGGGVSAACVSCCMVVVAPNDGRSEAQRPESRPVRRRQAEPMVAGEVGGRSQA